jgi:uncharacterized protein YuzE
VVPFDLTWDATTDVAYLLLARPEPGTAVGPTLLLEADPAFPGVVAADFTEADGRLVGFEVQFASQCLPPAVLAQARRIDGQHLAHVLELRVWPNVDGIRFVE